jgi:hypothetical protein
MDSIYVVIENGDPYPNAYTSYSSAIAAVQEKYNEIVADQVKEANGGSICSNIDDPEDESGKTYLYVEKEIHIYIYKLPILSSA